MRWFSQAPTPRPLQLALQGGGAHGAFSWGVLDALLEDGGLSFEAVSGCSAGAMNAALLAQGLMEDGREGARAALARFWGALAASMPPQLTRELPEGGAALSPLASLMLHWTHYLGPEQLNPLDLNPLRDILLQQLDFERLRRAAPLRLYLSATEANSGRLRLFRETELSAEVLLASACLPSVYRAVEIEGQAFWDGGYAANPAIAPLVFEGRAPDLLLVLLSPLQHGQTPRTAAEIRQRTLELGFAAGFLSEMRLLARLRRAQAGRPWALLDPASRRLARCCFHLVEAGDVLGALPADSKLVVQQRFFEQLRDLGRARAQAWLARHRGDLGRRSSADLKALFG